MNFDNFTNVTNTQERDLEMSRVFPSLMRKVYIWMTMALAITGVVAYGAGNSPALIQFLYMGRGAMIVMALVEFGIVWYLSSRIDKLSLTAATIWFIIFATVNGLTLGWIFAAFSSVAITKTFLVTAGTFGAMALIGSTTKKDLTKMGGYPLHGPYRSYHCRSCEHFPKECNVRFHRKWYRCTCLYRTYCMGRSED